MHRTFRFRLIFSTLLLVPLLGRTDEPAASPKPELKLIVPLAVARGSTNHLILRGLHLDQATEVRTSDSNASVKLNITMELANAPPNGLDAQRVGDTEVQVDLEIPADLESDRLELLVATPQGETMPVAIDVFSAESFVAEQEPNDGFASAHELAVDKCYVGSIHDSRNVDVFRVHLTTGQRFVAEVTAARSHSPLDPLLQLYDVHGTILCTHDDTGSSRDALLQFTATSESDYLLCLFDANDTGSPLHSYVLRVQVE